MIDKEVNHYCDVCGTELTEYELASNEEFKNYEFPICESCIEKAISDIEYIREQ